MYLKFESSVRPDWIILICIQLSLEKLSYKSILSVYATILKGALGYGDA